MAIGDEQIDRLTRNLQSVADKTVADIDALLTGKVAEIRELLNGITFYGGVKAAEVRPADPAA